jgi:guanylate kinase
MKNITSATLYIISAASGTGKTTLVKALLASLNNIIVSISHTTRPPRPAEIPDQDYHFVSKEKFNDMINHNEFIEYATIYGELYGTSKVETQKLLDTNQDVLLEIDWQGARNIRQIMPNVISIFILPPSKAELRQRIFKRKQDATPIIEKRLEKASSEMDHYAEYDFLIINDNFEQALLELKSIIIAQRCQQIVQAEKYKKLITRLLAFD